MHTSFMGSFGWCESPLLFNLSAWIESVADLKLISNSRLGNDKHLEEAAGDCAYFKVAQLFLQWFEKAQP